MAFSFVQWISDVAPGRSAKGGMLLPPSREAVSPSLVTEAVGQLAAWTTMAAVDFRTRPVAGLAGEVALITDVPGGLDLDLEVAIRRLNPDSVAYDGRAILGGRVVLELRHAVGPLLDTEELDDPDVLRDRFSDLCGRHGTDAPVGEWPLVAPHLLAADGSPDARRARLDVPAEAAFYAGHFPRRPVFPGTLLLESAVRLAALLGRERDPGARVTSVRSVKFRRFLEPGTTVDLELRVRERTREGLEVAFEAAADGQRVASARLEVGAAG